MEENNSASEQEIKKLSEQLACARAEIEKYKSKLDDISQKYPEEIQLSDADPRVSTLMAQLRGEKTAGLLAAAAGKVPKL